MVSSRSDKLPLISNEAACFSSRFRYFNDLLQNLFGEVEPVLCAVLWFWFVPRLRNISFRIYLLFNGSVLDDASIGISINQLCAMMIFLYCTSAWGTP